MYECVCSSVLGCQASTPGDAAFAAMRGNGARAPLELVSTASGNRPLIILLFATRLLKVVS